MSTPAPEAPKARESVATPSLARLRAGKLLGFGLLGALVLAVTFSTGFAMGGRDAAREATLATNSAEAAEARAENLQDRLDMAIGERDAAWEDLDAVRAVTDELEEREAAVIAREQELTQEEAAAALREFGDGVHVVGETVEAGTYRANPSGMCYYAWMGGTGADARIIDNNIVYGTTTVTLAAGDVFESNRCGTWTKTG